ncbi:Photosystem II PsbP [Quillaja saponaria]|uniref:Photosystem II PsbP n=1 Tax=Quillaja saponaria TaxID=32244 RepID=A0AAD7LZN5_QUISA|nr:Photosystem II PsbP [Quillaja saponaria]
MVAGGQSIQKGMASVSSSCSSLQRRPPTSICHLTTAASTRGKGIKRFILRCKNSQRDIEQRFSIQEPCWAKRREVMLGVAAGAFSFISFAAAIPNALAAEGAVSDVAQEFRSYTDDVNKFKILIPQEWQVGGGEPNGFKSVTAFYPEDQASNSNVSVVITGLGPDFTRMESFGKVEAFAETLVSGLDRSWQRPAGVAAKLIDCKASNGFYYIDYSLQNPGESCRHLFSAIGMASNGWYNRLYTVTGQFLEEDSDKDSSKVKKAVTSFKFI